MNIYIRHNEAGQITGTTTKEPGNGLYITMTMDAFNAAADALPAPPNRVDLVNGTVIRGGDTEKAKVHRDEVIDSPVLAHGVYWDVNQRSRDNINTTIATIERNNYPPETTVVWTLADNSERATTAVELGVVLDAYALRMQEVFSAYQAWRAADDGSDFVYQESADGSDGS